MATQRRDGRGRRCSREQGRRSRQVCAPHHACYMHASKQASESLPCVCSGRHAAGAGAAHHGGAVQACPGEKGTHASACGVGQVCLSSVHAHEGCGTQLGRLRMPRPPHPPLQPPAHAMACSTLVTPPSVYPLCTALPAGRTGACTGPEPVPPRLAQRPGAGQAAAAGPEGRTHGPSGCDIMVAQVACIGDVA